MEQSHENMEAASLVSGAEHSDMDSETSHLEEEHNSAVQPNQAQRGGGRNGRRFSQAHGNFSRGGRFFKVFIAGVALFLIVLAVLFSAGTKPLSDSQAPLALIPTAPLSPDLSVIDPGNQYCTTWSANSTEWPHLETEPKPLDPHLKAVPGFPLGLKVVGIIFYGRARYTDILDCYLKRNLKSNGGLLDEVAFMNHTQQTSDLDFLSEVVAKEHDYRILAPPEDCQGNHYGCIWSYIVNSGLYDDKTLLIKIDDDIVYVHDNVISQLVQSRIAHPAAFAISANLVNSPLTGYLHYHSGAIHPYLPEPAETHALVSNRPTWRASELPDYDGPFAFDLDVESMIPPREGHRWLPVKVPSIPLLITPMGAVDSVQQLDFGTYWRSWATAAQQHYSLFQNLESDTMERYHLSSNLHSNDDSNLQGMYHMQYRRYNLNFLAVWAKDVRANLPIDADDEEAFTVTLPRKLGRPLLIDTRAVVAHFSFYTQHDGMVTTDVLDRYRAYANEMVCKVGAKRVPLGEKPCAVFQQE